MKNLTATSTLGIDDLQVFVLDISGLAISDVQIDHLGLPDRRRMEKYLYEIDQLRFSTARTALYSILSVYLPVKQQDMILRFNDYGKPFLPSSDLYFNVSHSGLRIALAFCWHDDIGIDVEEKVPQDDLPAVAERFFSVRERAGLKSLSSKNQLESFYRCWTRKEAFCKALGLGVSAPLDKFSVEFREGYSASLQELDPSLGKTSDWLLRDIPIDAPYAGAVACRNEQKKVHIKELTYHELITLSQ